MSRSAGCLLLIASCHPAAPAAHAPQTGPLSLFAEGLCAKLEVYAAGAKTFIAYGSYGLDEHGRAGSLGAAQAFAELRSGTPLFDPSLLEGLPRRAGWIAGDVELGGRWPDAFWLTLSETARAHGQGGALFERRRSYYSFEGGWRLGGRARRAATPGSGLPDLPETEICRDGLRFSIYATARSASGDTIVAGRCEDALGRAPGGVELAGYFAGAERWRVDEAPPSELFAQIVNVALVMRSRREAYLYAYPPYATGDAEAYLVRFDGRRWARVRLPFDGPVVAMTADERGDLWAITGWRTLRRLAAPHDGWERVPLPPPRFVSPLPERMRLLDVRFVSGAVWVHAAYPVSLGGAAGRGHVLYTTTRVSAPLYCDRRRRADRALSHEPERLVGAEELTLPVKKTD